MGLEKQSMKNVLILLALITVVGCSSQPLSSREKGTLGGGALGAGLGAIIGNQVGNTGAGIAIGGAAGAISGALIGNEVDNQDVARSEQDERLRRQEEELRRQRREIEELRRQDRYQDSPTYRNGRDDFRSGGGGDRY